MAARLAGPRPVVSAQLEYLPLRRDIEREVVPAVLDAGAGLLPWSPLGRGVLTGKYRTGIPAGSRAAAPHFAEFVQPYLDEECARIVESVVTAAEASAGPRSRWRWRGSATARASPPRSSAPAPPRSSARSWRARI